VNASDRFALPFCIILLTAGFLLAGCDTFGGDEYRPEVTEILKVRVKPNPVAVGDTAVFTCVVEDSADTTLSFVWFLGDDVNTTSINQFRWKPPGDTIRTFSHLVEVERPGDANVQSTQKRFEVTVVEDE